MNEKGQILEAAPMGVFLRSLADNRKFKKYVEIGTWKGQGSTKCITDGLLKRDDDSCLYTLEVELPFYKEARHYWDPILAAYRREKVIFLRGSAVDSSSYGIPPWKEVEETLKITNQMDMVSLYRLWYRTTVERWLTEEAPLKENNDCFISIFNKIPNNIDVLLLDGGEITSYAEFYALNSRGEVKVAVLDDIYIFKNYKLHNELSQAENWEMIALSHDRHGWSAFCQKKYLHLLERENI
tara:strand:+ start:12871 stop:13590 length:720 start_codon:yes stop_codon:yes gene_type:complete